MCISPSKEVNTEVGAKSPLHESAPSRISTNHPLVCSSNSPEDRRSAPPGIPLAAVTRAAGPAGPCDVRGVMLHLGPGASQQAGSLPPRMFPRGIPSAALPAQSQVPSGLCGSRASRMLGSLSLASSGHLTPHGQPGGGTRPPGSAPLHRLPARRPPPCRKEAPRPGLRHRVSCLTPCLRPPKNPVATRQGLRFWNVVRVVHIGGLSIRVRPFVAIGR